MLPAGKSLRTLREKLGLTMRDVENSSARVADKYRNEEFSIPPSRLSDIETKGILPSIFRLYTLSVIYRRDLRELMSWYGVDLNNMAADLGLVSPPKSHVSDALAGLSSVQVPRAAWIPALTTGAPPTWAAWSSNGDWCPSPTSRNLPTAISLTVTSAPRISPCTRFCRPAVSSRWTNRRIKWSEGSWRSEYERPIYFVETRDGHTCCWCSMRREEIILQPHPLSPVPVRILRHPQEAEVLGQVVGVAMKLTEWHALDSSPASKAPAALN